MSEIEQKIAILESKIKRQRSTLQILVIVLSFSTFTSLSLQMKFDKMLHLLEELIQLTNLLVN